MEVFFSYMKRPHSLGQSVNRRYLISIVLLLNRKSEKQKKVNTREAFMYWSTRTSTNAKLWLIVDKNENTEEEASQTAFKFKGWAMFVVCVFESAKFRWKSN